MKDQHPPRWPDRFLRWFCSEEVLETLQGDLYELYRKRLAKSGKVIADLFFLLDVVSACRPFAFSKRSFLNSNNNIMIGHYLKVSARNLVRFKTYSFLNIFGLAVAIASSSPPAATRFSHLTMACSRLSSDAAIRRRCSASMRRRRSRSSSCRYRAPHSTDATFLRRWRQSSRQVGSRLRNWVRRRPTSCRPGSRSRRLRRTR